jgi:hypothetical protein
LLSALKFHSACFEIRVFVSDICPVAAGDIWFLSPFHQMLLFTRYILLACFNFFCYETHGGHAQDGSTVLSCAVSRGHADCVRLLLALGADKDAQCMVRFVVFMPVCMCFSYFNFLELRLHQVCVSVPHFLMNVTLRESPQSPFHV